MGFAVSDVLAADSPAAVERLLSADVVFHSPVADYTGRADVAHLLATIARCVHDVREGHGFLDGGRSATEFTGRVGDQAVDGVLIQRIDADGLLAEATLLLRPLAALRTAVGLMRDALAAAPLPSAG
ncbi:nuclear transport factor 2 family protein [Pseudonocardia nigra]|uniref:nuclear transport factor 2 family protein n=1 Tax=Pseudonocardia nigra TaxID=1921578 RepID=UPI001C5D3684|nr:nuclear transport factor 2 family protein [Pseudonocardia nigra]